MKLEIMISTLNEGIEKIDQIFLEERDTIQYLVIHQVWDTKNNYEITRRLQNRNDVHVYTYAEKGLSKSRNHAISKASSDICLIADDDIRLIHDLDTKILKAFHENPDADIITFQVAPSSQRINKAYSSTPFWYNMLKLIKVSSIEIAFRKSSIEKSGITFDEMFGLGAKYPLGEEFIFLSDAYRQGLKILYWPEIIVAHPHMSSGRKVEEQIIIAKGAVFGRVFGIFGYFINIYSTIKHLKLYREHYSLWRYLKFMFLGTYDYLKRKR